ncbi:hypothetical protein D3C85_1399790 [compost metagenome]
MSSPVRRLALSEAKPNKARIERPARWLGANLQGGYAAPQAQRGAMWATISCTLSWPRYSLTSSL